MSRHVTRGSRVNLESGRNTQREIARLRNDVGDALQVAASSGGSVVLPSTQVADIDHIFEAFDQYGILAPAVTIDATHFPVTIEVWTAGVMAAGIETYTIENKGSGVYRIVFTPMHPGSLYRTIVKCKPDGSTEGNTDPRQFQDVPLYTF